MISFPLLKQSIKANKNIWFIITVASSLMLMTIVFVTGNLNVGELRDSFSDTFVKSEIESEIRKNSINAYIEVNDTVNTIYPQASNLYDLSSATLFVYSAYVDALHPTPKEAAIAEIQSQSTPELAEFAAGVASAIIDRYEVELPSSETLLDFKVQFVTDTIVANIGQDIDENTIALIQALSTQIIELYADTNSLTTVQLQTISSTFTKELFVSKIDAETMILFEENDFDIDRINSLVSSSLIQYIALTNSGVESDDAISQISVSILSQMPSEVTDSLSEIIDLNIDHLVVGTIFYKIAGLLLPLVYVIVTANSLLAGQVDSGSMVYVLSTPTKRKVVTLTQISFLVMSLFVMYLIILLSGIIAIQLVNNPNLMITVSDITILTIGAFITMFSIAGINFLTSAWFDKSKNATGLGGGISIFFLVSTILGLLGSEVIPTAIRIDSLNFFNYFSLITLYDVISVLEGNINYLNFAILIFIGSLCFAIGHLKFNKKDLPL